MTILPIVTDQRAGMYDITAQLNAIVAQSGVAEGACRVFAPHTTAALTVNENADPDVVRDLLLAWDAMVPRLPYQHSEGNSRAHVLSSLLGVSLILPVSQSRLCLGVWQAVYFCEFDGPRQRTCRVWVDVAQDMR